MEKASESHAIVMPCMNAQIWNCTEDAEQVSKTSLLRVNGAEPRYFAIVGLVTYLSLEGGGWSMGLDDGTGTMDVTLYPDSERVKDCLLNKETPIRTGSYVRLIGKVRRDPVVSFLALDVMLIDDHNYIIYHALQCVLARERSKRQQQAPRPLAPQEYFAPSPNKITPSIDEGSMYTMMPKKNPDVYVRQILGILRTHSPIRRNDLSAILATSGLADPKQLDQALTQLETQCRVYVNGDYIILTGF